MLILQICLLTGLRGTRFLMGSIHCLHPIELGQGVAFEKVSKTSNRSRNMKLCQERRRASGVSPIFIRFIVGRMVSSTRFTVCLVSVAKIGCSEPHARAFWATSSELLIRPAGNNEPHGCKNVLRLIPYWKTSDTCVLWIQKLCRPNWPAEFKSIFFWESKCRFLSMRSPTLESACAVAGVLSQLRKSIPSTHAPSCRILSATRRTTGWK